MRFTNNEMKGDAISSKNNAAFTKYDVNLYHIAFIVRQASSASCIVVISAFFLGVRPAVSVRRAERHERDTAAEKRDRAPPQGRHECDAETDEAHTEDEEPSIIHVSWPFIHGRSPTVHSAKKLG